MRMTTRMLLAAVDNGDDGNADAAAAAGAAAAAVLAAVPAAGFVVPVLAVSRTGAAGAEERGRAKCALGSSRDRAVQCAH